MRIRAERDDLADVFSRANRGVGVRSALPILQGVLCEVIGSTLHVTGTDLEMTVRTAADVEVMEEGRFVVPGKLVTEAIRKMPVGAVTMSSSEGEIEIVGNGPQFRIRELTVDDFPELGEPNFTGAVAVDGDMLASAVAQVTVAASVDAARPILSGVLVENGHNGIRMVATDSYRLAVCDLPEVRIDASGLIPARGLRELSRTIGSSQVQVAIRDREAVFGSERGSLSLRLIEGTFPNYRQLLPDSYPNRMTVDKDRLLEALGRASLVAADHIPIRLKLQDGGIELTVNRQDVGGETEHIEGSFVGEIGEVDIAFNPRYLTDGVSAMEGDEVAIDVIDGLKPSVMRATGKGEFLYLLMPVRV